MKARKWAWKLPTTSSSSSFPFSTLQHLEIIRTIKTNKKHKTLNKRTTEAEAAAKNYPILGTNSLSLSSTTTPPPPLNNQTIVLVLLLFLPPPLFYCTPHYTAAHLPPPPLPPSSPSSNSRPPLHNQQQQNKTKKSKGKTLKTLRGGQ